MLSLVRDTGCYLQLGQTWPSCFQGTALLGPDMPLILGWGRGHWTKTETSAAGNLLLGALQPPPTTLLIYPSSLGQPNPRGGSGRMLLPAAVTRSHPGSPNFLAPHQMTFSDF